MRKIFLLSFCASLFVLGCGTSAKPKPKVYPVTGKVTQGGKPLGDCTIGFALVTAPAGAPPGYSGVVAADGTYKLVDPSDGKEGAAEGKYKVVLNPSPQSAQKAMMAPGAMGPGYAGGVGGIPQKNQQAATTDIEKEVKADDKGNVIDISIP